jgi:membrane protein required for colicin V production
MELLAIDYVVFAVLLVSAALSLMRGFTKEVLSIAGWVLAAYAAIYFGPLLKPFLASYIDIAWVVNAGAMLLVFLFVLVVFSIAANAFAKTMKASPMGVLDRTLGVIFGALRGAVIVCLGYFIFVLILPEKDHSDWLATAETRPLMQTGTKLLLTFVPLDRLPLNISNIDGMLSDNPEATQTLKGIGQSVLDGTMQPTSDNPNEKQDSASDTGYKQSERNSMERLIRNSEGVE